MKDSLSEFLKNQVEYMHTNQMNQINDSIIKDAGEIISKLLNIMSAGNTPEKYEVITEARKWLKNNKK